MSDPAAAQKAGGAGSSAGTRASLGLTPDPASTEQTPLLRVTDLKKHFVGRRRLWRRDQPVRAVDGISFHIEESETLGLVGESGCGKSTAGQAVLRLIEPTAGTIEYDGRDITNVGGGELRQLRRELQIIFQDPYASLNPRMTVFEIVSEPWRVFREIRPRRSWRSAAGDLLERVGLNVDHANRYPHQFSGGQRQRVGIARALAMQPRLIVCDEPVSALDVSVQAQVINLLRRIQADTGVAYLFISHDLSVVRHLCSRVMVMYLGKCVEIGPTHEVFGAPTHPYTRALIDAVPVADPNRRGRKRIVLTGEVPNPKDPPSGCGFRTRCWKADERCATTQPPLEVRQGGVAGACFHPEPAPIRPSR